MIDEISAGDPEIAKRRLAIISKFKQLDLTDEVKILAKTILDSRIIPQKSATDAAHISLSTVHGMQFLLTWNCIHLANAEIIVKIKRICEIQDYELPLICTPEELMGV